MEESDYKINWKHFWDLDHNKSALYDFACEFITFEEFENVLYKTSEIKNELEKMKNIPESLVKRRAKNALNQHGTPISGVRKYVFYAGI